ncbi:MAG TPA: 3'(2'),5'-bisphosphate nucleotidase CysQ [Allosphingosinicella sp.]
MKDLSDEELAARLAEEAGRLLLELRGAAGGANGLGIAGDKAANAWLIDSLAEARPDDAILSEESPDLLKRLQCERVWIIDPLDGTREYAEGRDDWAVHVALAIDGVPAIGAVAIPAHGRLFRSGRVRLPPAPDRVRPIMLVSRTRPPPETEAVADLLGADLVAMGSAGAKAMAVVAGEADIYLHSGGQHEWDNCAPAAVALAAGLHASRIDGSPLVYNQADTCMPDLLIARPEYAPAILSYCASR